MVITQISLLNICLLCSCLAWYFCDSCQRGTFYFCRRQEGRGPADRQRCASSCGFNGVCERSRWSRQTGLMAQGAIAQTIHHRRGTPKLTSAISLALPGPRLTTLTHESQCPTTCSMCRCSHQHKSTFSLYNKSTALQLYTCLVAHYTVIQGL